jgi:Sec-independent protein secretion pathway component TatC
MYLLYEVSVWIVRLVERGIARKKQQQELAELAEARAAAVVDG